MTLPLAALLQGAVAGGPTGQTYVDDVFSTYLYTGNGSTQTITNGIDLAGKGGMVWIKDRTAANSNALFDTVRGGGRRLVSNTTGASSGDVYGISYSATGFAAATADSSINANAEAYVAWSFRKAAKFFDCGTFTTGTNSNRRITHSLGIAPGLILAKATDGGGGTWYVYHRSRGRGVFLQLELTSAETVLSNVWGSSDPTTADFGVDESQMWAAGRQIVWYAWAHDTAADGIIQCGSFTTDGSGNATVTLGWEPQWLLVKGTAAGASWVIADQARGFTATTNGNVLLYPNTASADDPGNYIPGQPTATGFNAKGSATSTYIYLAIRRPNKPPTSGTQVYEGTVSSAATGTQLTTGFPVDMQFLFDRPVGGVGRTTVADRLRGASSTSTTLALNLITSSSGAEANTYNATRNWNNTGFEMPNSFGGESMVFHSFRRAPGVFDEVCYTGTGVANRAITHGLGVIPEMIIVKDRTSANLGMVYTAAGGNGVFLRLFDGSTGNYGFTTNASPWNNTSPTATQFTVDGDGGYIYVNANGDAYVAYLFATKAGISKVFSFTGNGTNQNIECGFTTGARFVLLKRTDSAGNWLVADTARGIVAGNDPSLALNSTAAEVTTVDWIDPYSGGFNVVQESTNNVNVNNATYIGIAFA